MDRSATLKLSATCLLLIFIDRIEFAYYPFEGLDRKIPFLIYDKPMQISWYVYLISILIQHFAWTIVLWIWVPMQKEFKWVVIAFFLCVVEFHITYGRPIVTLPLPWNWFFPISCSLLRLAAVMYYLVCVVRKYLNS